MFNFFTFKWKKERFLEEKRDILRVFSSLLSDINVDKNNWKIEPENIENIWNDLIYFMKKIEKIQKLLTKITNEELLNNNLEKEKIFLKENKKWLFNFSLEFIKKTKKWQNFHKKELLKLIKKIDFLSFSIEKNSENKLIKNTLFWNLNFHKKIIEKQISILK